MLPDGVEPIGLVADRLGLLRHLDDAARVVGDRPERVHRQDVRARREHAHRGDGGAIQAGAVGAGQRELAELVGRHQRDRDHDHRQAGALHADREAGDDVRGGPGAAGLGDRPHRPVLVLRVVLRDPDEGVGGQDPDDAGGEQVAGVRDCGRARDRPEQQVDRRGEADHGEDGRDQVAAVEAVHRVLVLAHLDGVDTDHRRDQAEGAREQREQDPAQPEHRVERDAEDHGPDVLGGRRLEEVGAAAGAVADVVAHQVGDHRGVARVVLGDAGLDLADEVGAHVGRLGVDPAAELGEEGHEAGAEPEADDLQRHVPVVLHPAEQPEETPHAEQAHRHDREAGDGAAPKCDLQRPVEARHRGRGRADVGPDRHEHADVAGDRRAQRADQEGDRDLPEGPLPHLLDVRHVTIEEVEREDRRRGHDRQHADRAVLAREERLGALADRVGDRAHLGLAGVRGQHLAREQPGDAQRQQADPDHDRQDGFDWHEASEWIQAEWLRCMAARRILRRPAREPIRSL